MAAKRQLSQTHDVQPQFDAALSYAREDVAHATRLYQRLTRRGLKVFFDKAHAADLWGEDERHLSHIFGPGSRFVLPLISEAYANKTWTRFEFETAKKEEARTNEKRVLPIRLDDTHFMGMGGHAFGMDLRRDSFKTIVDTLWEKLGREPDKHTPKPFSQGTAPSTKKPTRVTPLLAGSARQALGLLAVTDVPLPRSAFEDLFPLHPWRKVFAEARQLGWVRVEMGVVEVAPQLKRTLCTDEDEVKAFRQQWVKAIEPHREHYDISLVAVLHLLSLRQFSEAVDLLLVHAPAVPEPFWVELYEMVLRGLANSKQLDQLSADQKILVLNSWAMCLVQLRRSAEARDIFDRMHQLSCELSNAWGVGQALINGGKARALLGDERARVFYRAAAWHARRTKDQVLLGRALGNLAFMYLDQPKRAARFLEESLAAKHAIGDDDGMIAGAIAQGMLAAKQDQFRAAEQHFRDAKKRAAGLGKLGEQAFATANLGQIYIIRGRYKAALKTFEEVNRRWEGREVPFDARVQALNGAALAHKKLGKLARAERTLRELVELTRGKGTESDLLQAQHTLIAILAERRKLQEARALLDDMLKFAKRRGLLPWVFAYLRSKADLLDEGDTAKRISLLRYARKVARKARESSNWAEASVRLAEIYANRRLFTKAETLLREVEHVEKNPELRHMLMLDRLELLWRAKRYRASETLFSKVRTLSERTNQAALYVAAHMRFADVLWEGGRASQIDALQAYLAALARSMVSNQDMGSGVGMHIYRQLFQMPLQMRASKLQMFQQELGAWLASQADLRESEDLQHLLLWPLRLAQAVTEFEQRGGKLTHSTIMRISKRVFADIKA